MTIMTNDEDLFITSSNGGSLETRFQSVDPVRTRIAFIAHPYGLLGGNYNSPIVTGLATLLSTRYRYSVVSWNARGVGRSTGRQSITGQHLVHCIDRGVPEVEDYQSVIDYVVSKATETTADVNDNDDQFEILICGYSFGSLAASCCKAPGPERWRTRYIIISYPTWFVSMLSWIPSSPFRSALESLAKDINTPLLSIRGTRDAVFSDAGYTKWETKLAVCSNASKFVKVEGAEHFWTSAGVIDTMLQEVETWLQETGTSQNT